MKTIAFVTPWYAENIPGGAETALRGLAEHLQCSGNNIEILTTCVEKFSSDWNIDFYKEGTEYINGVRVRRFKVRKRNVRSFDEINHKFIKMLPVSFAEEEVFLREMVNSPELYDYIEEYRKDYSVFVFTPYMFGTTFFGIQRCIEQAVLIPCLHDEGYAFMEHLKEHFSKVRGMAFLSEPEYILAHQIYDLRNVHTSVLGTGLDTQVLADQERFRNKYGIRSPFILYAGRKDAGKNVPLLISFFRKYKLKNKTELKLILMGGGKIEIPEDMKNEICDLGFIAVQDKYDAYAAAECLCNPSRFESFSLVIMESWLCGRPVVVSAECEVMVNFVSESNGGLYFSNYPEFEACVDYISGHPKEADLMGRNGREFVLSNFDWNVVVKRYKEFFEECCV